MNPKTPNLQHQIQKIRRYLLWLCLVAIVIFAGILLFVPVDERVNATGIVRAERDTYLYSPENGIIGRAEVREGDRVEKGDPIILIDDTELQDRLLQIDAAREKAKVELSRKEKSLERITHLPLPSEFWHMQEESGVAMERIRHSELELQRSKELHDKGLVSKQDLERASLSHQVAKAELSKTREKMRIVDTGLEGTILEEVAAEIQAAQSALRELEVEKQICQAAIERSVIRTPEAGIVTSILKKRPGIGVTRGEPLAHISHGDNTRVDLYCGESQYYRLEVGQRVLLRSNTFDTLRHGYVEGTVVKLAVEPEIEDEEIPTGTQAQSTGPKYRVTTRIESTPQELVLGSTVEGRIIIRRIPIWKLLLPDNLK